MNKKGLSPLVSTIMLVLLAVGIGIIVMVWGQTQILEPGSKCSVDTELEFVTLNGAPQVCYSGKGDIGFVEIWVENGVNYKIDSVLVRIIGSKPLNEDVNKQIKKANKEQLLIPYNFDEYGQIKSVEVIPKIKPLSDVLICKEQMITATNIKPC